MKPFAIFAVILGLISGVLLKGTFEHRMIVICVMAFLGVPLSFFMVLWALIAWKRTAALSTGFRTLFCASSIVAGALLVSLGIGTALHNSEIQKTRRYVATIIPTLEEYRTLHGEYPKTLASLKAPAPPALLNGSHSYSADSKSFRLEYWDPAGMMDGYYFDSSTREWTYFD